MSKKVKIIYVDDEEVNVMLFEINFSVNFEVYSGCSGFEGLELLDKHPDVKVMQIVKGKGDLYILNDTYNANPASMRAGLATLAQQGKGRRVQGH